MIIKIYKYLSNFIFIPVLVFFFLRLFLSKESKKSIFQKFFFSKSKRPKGKLIWINGVSIGEAKSGLIVAQKVLKNEPHSNILFSTSTLTAFNIISGLEKNITLIYSPVDISFVIKRFLKYWRPDSVIFMESEIWPNIISELNENKINFNILNGRISKKSFFFWKKISFFSRDLFSKIDKCFVQDQHSKKRFELLGAKNVQLMTNLKFLTNEKNSNKHELKVLKKNLNKKIIITFFSCHENEEQILIDCYQNLKKKNNNLFFVIVPRHIQKTNGIISKLQKSEIKFSVRSKCKNINSDNIFYVADTYGELNFFFHLSNIAIVGGSFKKIGGHNPVEVRHHNCVLFFGPHMFNFLEIKEKILEENAGFEVGNSKELSEKIQLIIDNKILAKEMIGNFKQLCRKESKKAMLVLKQIA
mgnify:CR=1 FL=1